MMTRLIDIAESEKLGRISKKAIAMFIVIALSTVGVTVGLCFAVSRELEILFCVIISVWITLGGGACIFVLTAYILPLRQRRAFLSQISALTEIEEVGTVTGIGEAYTISYGEKAVDVTLDCDGKLRKFYWVLSCGDCVLHVGDVYNLLVSNNYITAYEATS